MIISKRKQTAATERSKNYAAGVFSIREETIP